MTLFLVYNVFVLGMRKLMRLTMGGLALYAVGGARGESVKLSVLYVSSNTVTDRSHHL